MSSIKDRLKSSQGGGNTYPKLPVVATIEIKEDGDSVAFQTYDKASSSNINYPSPITGIFIGSAMQMSSYSDNLGRNGGQYKSEHYVNNSHPVSLFAPNGQKYEVAFKGTAPELEDFINKNSTSNAKKRQVLYVLTSEGMVAVITNLSIAIDQIGANKEALTEKMIVLEPRLFSEQDETISKKSKEYLGKFRTKNPPKYASVSIGQDISETDWQYMKADEAVEAYTTWRKFKEGGGTAPDKQEDAANQSTPAESEPRDYHRPTPPPAPVAPIEDDLSSLPF